MLIGDKARSIVFLRITPSALAPTAPAYASRPSTSRPLQ